MFGLLYRCTTEEQRNVAKAALYKYVEIWNTKHKDDLQPIPGRVLANETKGKRPEFPEFPEDLDPADAEFENGLIEFYNGAYFFTGHSRRTEHFATAIRSAVTARQINRWLHEHPNDYAKWKAGHGIDGPTFLDDEAAADEAQMIWRFVDDVMKKQLLLPSSKQITRLYRRWEESIL